MRQYEHKPLLSMKKNIWFFVASKKAEKLTNFLLCICVSSEYEVFFLRAEVSNHTKTEQHKYVKSCPHYFNFHSI